MGKRLTSIFDEARQLGGLAATIRLAKLSHISSIDARNLPDTQDSIKKLEKGFEVVKKEFGTSDNDVKQIPVKEDFGLDTTKSLRGYMQVLSDVLASQTFHYNDMELVYQQVTSALSEALHVSRASVWCYNEPKATMVCVDLFERNKSSHSNGDTLSESEFPRYFKAITSSRTVAAKDVYTDIRTSELSTSYLRPLGINSLLDVPILDAHGKLIGLVSHEHTGPKREWNSDEENFAYLMSNILSLSIERTHTSQSNPFLELSA